MRTVATLSALFMLGGSVGWLLELLYRRLAHGKWINPGFLTGPCLPLYGTGVLLLYGFCSWDMSWIPATAWRETVRILLLAAVLTAVEYVTGWIFTRYFHVKLWDYSNRRGNIGGIICPLFSLIWGILGAGYALLLHPHIVHFVDFLSRNPIYHFFSGMYIGIFLVDVGYSFRVVTKIRRFAKEQALVVRYENLKLQIARRAEELKQRRNFVFPFRSAAGLLEELAQYRKELRESLARKMKK